MPSTTSLEAEFGISISILSSQENNIAKLRKRNGLICFKIRLNYLLVNLCKLLFYGL